MPHIQVNATCPIDREQEQQLITQIGDAISLLPGMKAEYLMIRLEDDCRLFFRGDRKLRLCGDRSLWTDSGGSQPGIDETPF